jgi:hypothetical protein
MTWVLKQQKIKRLDLRRWRRQMRARRQLAEISVSVWRWILAWVVVVVLVIENAGIQTVRSKRASYG